MKGFGSFWFAYDFPEVLWILHGSSKLSISSGLILNLNPKRTHTMVACHGSLYSFDPDQDAPVPSNWGIWPPKYSGSERRYMEGLG